jgi:LuxR family maltose regulon positive regulatory protein
MLRVLAQNVRREQGEPRTLSFWGNQQEPLQMLGLSKFSRFLPRLSRAKRNEKMRFILDKITVPTERARISREGLLNVLHGSLKACTSTIINGRAGTGKTLLAADFARRCGRRVAWYKVDASDSDLCIFFHYLTESVRRQRPDFGHEALARLVEETEAIEDTPLLAEAFVYELLESGDSPLVIVVDDLHLVYDAPWVVPFFRRLLPLLPAEAHMLITGRSLPPAPLWRMRSKQTLCVIEESNLAFTTEEARKLFESYGLADGLGDTLAVAAMEQTHGRAAVLDAIAQLASASGQMPVESFVAARKRLRERRVRHVHGFSY